MQFSHQLWPIDDVLYKGCVVSWLATVMEWGLRYGGVGNKGVGVLKPHHRIPVAVLSIGYAFSGCPKVGPSY